MKKFVLLYTGTRDQAPTEESTAAWIEWFGSLGNYQVRGAAFDTRVHGPAALTGRAAKGVTRLLREHGFDVVAEPESFLVTRKDRLEPQEQNRARDWAVKLAGKSPLIMRLGKDAMFRQQDMAFLDALDYLRSQLTIAQSTDDIVEGVTAFFEKREPQWTGR